MISNRQARPDGELRRGWTTGACATAATKAAMTALVTGEFPDPVQITLPKGEAPFFPLSFESRNASGAQAGIVKDAGDDPDVTHGATIISHVTPMPRGTGIVFKAGDGVGIVTQPGLPVMPGEPAINPVPRQLMRDVVGEICSQHLLPPDIQITISIPGGQQLAEQTWNPRLGIKGGLSILGTTGIVHPFSCSAWIHSIHRGIDVARAAGYDHVIAATGSTSERAAQNLYDLPETALLDMGDFAGGLLKYLRQHPVSRITIAGGFAKLGKLAKGALDLHSGRSQVDFDWLAEQVKLLCEPDLNQSLKDQILDANTASHVLDIIEPYKLPLPDLIARGAKETALEVLREAPVEVEIIIVDRQGGILARA